MHRVLLLWAPDTAENRRVIDAVDEAFSAAKLASLVKKAAEATVADITASEIVVFGTQKTGTAELPAEYSEYLRVFKGITLAGRTAGFFSVGPEKATARLRKALKDTEIAQIEEDPLFRDQKAGSTEENLPDTTAQIAAWVRKLVGFHQERKNNHA
jgi:flavodoxin